MGTLYVNGPYKQVNGQAITVVSTDINGGSIKTPSSSNDIIRSSHWSQGNNLNPSVKAGVAGIAQADWNTFAQAVYTGGVSGVGAVTGVTQASSNFTGLIKLNHASHGFATGQAIHLRYNPTNDTGVYNGVYRVVSVIDANSVVLNGAYLNNITGIHYSTAKGSVANQTPGQYSMKKFNGTVHGLVNTTLQAGAADYGRNKIAKISALRTSKVTTAIRSGYWNMFTAEWSTKPALANDYTSMDIDGTNVPDDETKDSTTKYGTKGEFTYQFGGRTITTGDYEAKTG